jgi:hypothetical protein
VSGAPRTKFLTISRLHGMKWQTYQNSQRKSLAPTLLTTPQPPPAGEITFYVGIKIKTLGFETRISPAGGGRGVVSAQALRTTKGRILLYRCCPPAPGAWRGRPQGGVRVQRAPRRMPKPGRDRPRCRPQGGSGGAPKKIHCILGDWLFGGNVVCLLGMGGVNDEYRRNTKHK